MLGDFLIPVWNEQRERALDLQMTRRDTESGILLILTPSEGLSNAPIVYADGTFYSFDKVGLSFELPLSEEPVELTVGFPSTQPQYFFAENLSLELE